MSFFSKTGGANVDRLALENIAFGVASGTHFCSGHGLLLFILALQVNFSNPRTRIQTATNVSDGETKRPPPWAVCRAALS